MSTTLRNRRTAYDNIAVAAATGTERTISGSAPPTQTWGQGENIQVAVDYGKENVIERGTALATGERLG